MLVRCSGKTVVVYIIKGFDAIGAACMEMVSGRNEFPLLSQGVGDRRYDKFLRFRVTPTAYCTSRKTLHKRSPGYYNLFVRVYLTLASLKSCFTISLRQRLTSEGSEASAAYNKD